MPLPRLPRVLRFFFAALLALVALPALALAAPDPEGLGTWIVPRVAFDCRLFEVLPGKAATVPDGFVPAGRAVKWKRGTIPAGMLRSFFDGSFEAMEGVSLAWSGSLEASRFSPARVSVPLPQSAASTRKLDLSVSASHSDVANAARFDVGFAFRDAGTADEPSAAVPEETGDSGLVPRDSGFGIVLRGSSGPVDPDVLLAIGNWRLAGFERVPVRPVGLDELRPRYVALAALAVQGADRLAEALCRDFEDPAGHGAALAWIAEAANALGSSDPHPPADAPFLSDAGYVEALVAVGLAAFCESDWHDETSFEAILGIWAPHAPRSLRAHALARYAGQGNPAPGPRTLPAWRVGRPNRFEGDSPEARRAALELARSLVVRSVFGERDIPSAAVVFGLFPEAGPRLAAIDRGDSLPRVAASPVPAIAERAPLVGRAIRRAEEAAEADAAGYPPVRHPPPGEVEGLFLLAAPDRDPPVFAAGEPIHFDVALSNAGPFVVSVEETGQSREFLLDGRRPLGFIESNLLELSRHFWKELFPGDVGRSDRIDLADWVSNAVPRRVSATLRRNLDLFGHRYAETRVEFEIVPAPAADPATNAPAPALAPAEVDAASDCARFLESAFREIDPGTNGAPAAVVLGDLRWSMACESSISSDSGSAVRHCPWHPEAGERIVIPDKTELTLHIGKHQFVRIARIPPDTSLPESLDEKDRAVADAVGGPLLVVERRENYSSFGHAERNVAIRHYILPTGAREGHPFRPPAGAPARFFFADLAPAHAEPVPHAESAEDESHAENAESAEANPHAE